MSKELFVVGGVLDSLMLFKIRDTLVEERSSYLRGLRLLTFVSLFLYIQVTQKRVPTHFDQYPVR